MAKPNELIAQYFRYLISDFNFHIEKSEFYPSAMGNAIVEFRSSSIVIEIVLDRNAVSISIGDRLDEKQEWAEFAFVLKYYAPAVEHAYEFPEYTSGDTWDDIVLPQLNRLAKILREHCEPLLKGDLSAMERIKKMQREEVAKMKAKWSKAAGRNKKGI